MKKLVALVLVLLTMAVFAGSASARARGIIVWDGMGNDKDNGNHYGQLK